MRVIKERQAELLSDSRCVLAETPVWNEKENELLYIDMNGLQLHRMNWETKEEWVEDFPMKAGCIALCKDGSLLAGMVDGIYHQKEKGGPWVLAHAPYPVLGERYNDGKVGPDDALYLGPLKRDGGGHFVRFKDGSFQVLLDDVSISNGLDWSVDGTKMWYCDSATNQVEVFDFSEGALSGRRCLKEFPPEQGIPDGLCMDCDDNVWVAVAGSYQVQQLDGRTGEVLQAITVPVRRTTCCCFAGPEMDTLIITTAKPNPADGLEVEEHAGSIYAIKPGCKGRRPYLVDVPTYDSKE